jgi:hypothetical protein
VRFLIKASVSGLTLGLTLIIAGFHEVGQAQVFSDPSFLTHPSTPLVAENEIAGNDKADDAAEKVEEAIDTHPTLKPFDLDAEDQGNEIVLTGTVREASHKALAEQIAKETARGFAIVNRLVIQ